jgi:D-alanyl-D-alanine carboxypeptidase
MWGTTTQRVGAVLAGIALATGLTVAPASAEPDRDDVRKALAELTAAGMAGVQVRVQEGREGWTEVAGVERLGDDDPVPANGRFRVGSITKTFVATVVLQLVDEGKLTLDDPVVRHLPQYALDPRITVRMLLNHSSGLFNYTGDVNADGTVEPGIPLDGQEFVDRRFHVYTPADLVAVSLAKPARFEPGARFSYSNTNYVLAGELIQRLTGTPWGFQVNRRVVWPLGLRETVIPGTWPGIPGPHAHGYLAYTHEGQAKIVDVTRLSPTWGGAAGEIISTTRDLNRFTGALLGGRLLPADLLTEMRTPGADPAYGLGLQLVDLGPECGGAYQGHTGGIHGYVSFLFSNGDTRIAMSVTTGTVDPTSDPEAAEKINAAMVKVLLASVCDSVPAAAPRVAMG